MTTGPENHPDPGRRHPTPSPAAVALLAQCHRAKAAADSIPRVFTSMTPRPAASAAGGEVMLVVRPTCLAEWARWTHALGVRDVQQMKSTGTSVIVRCTYSGVPARLVGMGVPALLADAARPGGAGRG